jgi:hypothetical protein
MARVEPRGRSSNILGTAIQLVVLLLLLSLLAAVVFVFVAVQSVVNVPSQVTGGVGSQLQRAVGNAQTALQNAADPNHPPSGLVYDTEFAALDVWHVGDGLPGGTDYVLTLQSVKRRDGATSPETAQYAVIHAELRQPRQTRVLGQLIRSDSDAHDYVVYQGEMFRIGHSVYRMNWVSQDENAAASGVVRQPDAVIQPLKFEYD